MDSPNRELNPYSNGLQKKNKKNIADTKYKKSEKRKEEEKKGDRIRKID